jgi:hypothetical protein
LAQVDRAVAAARRAFDGWSRTTPGDRSAALLRIADRVEAEAQGFATLEALNCGKPINAALNDEIPAIVDCFRFFAGAVRTQHGQVAGEYLAGHTSMIRRDAIGVVASIAPWNYPLMMLAWKLAPAIGAGNTVVFKPSEQTPFTALKLARILAEELPEGVYRVANVEPGPAMFGWVTGQYRFARYKSEDKSQGARVLLTTQVGQIDAATAEAEAECHLRDLVNIPAEDMGPAALEAECEKLAKAHKAELTVVRGDALEQGYPMVHAVGRAAARRAGTPPSLRGGHAAARWGWSCCCAGHGDQPGGRRGGGRCRREGRCRCC